MLPDIFDCLAALLSKPDDLRIGQCATHPGRYPAQSKCIVVHDCKLQHGMQSPPPKRPYPVPLTHIMIISPYLDRLFSLLVSIIYSTIRYVHYKKI